jgi:hypothetical protein
MPVPVLVFSCTLASLDILTIKDNIIQKLNLINSDSEMIRKEKCRQPYLVIVQIQNHIRRKNL